MSCYFQIFHTQNCHPCAVCNRFHQVEEKHKVGISAINLNQSSISEGVVKKILKGGYHFIWLVCLWFCWWDVWVGCDTDTLSSQSPEIFLKNALFRKLYSNRNFQLRLILKVVDEAHLIYVWGLIAGGNSWYLATHNNCQDCGVFRPSYDNLCSQFLATDHAPILLMSATCCTQALRAILANLRWKDDDVVIIRGS